MPENLPPDLEKIYDLARQALKDLKEAEKYQGSEKRALLTRMGYLTKREIQEMDDLLEKLSDPEKIEEFLRANGIFDSSDTIDCLLLLIVITQARLAIHLIYEHPFLENLEKLEKMIETIFKCSWVVNYRWFDVWGFGGRLKIGWQKREGTKTKVKPK